MACFKHTIRPDMIITNSAMCLFTLPWLHAAEARIKQACNNRASHKYRTQFVYWPKSATAFYFLTTLEWPSSICCRLDATVECARLIQWLGLVRPTALIAAWMYRMRSTVHSASHQVTPLLLPVRFPYTCIPVVAIETRYGTGEDPDGRGRPGGPIRMVGHERLHVRWDVP